MATFGEIAEPSSRADFGWDDFQEDNVGEELQCCILNVDDFQMNRFIIIEGKPISDFITRYTSNLKHVTSIKSCNVEIYSYEQDSLFCFIDCYDIMKSSEIVAMLEPYLSRAKDVIGIQCKSLTEYLGTGLGSSICVIRGLYSNTDVQFAPMLTQPNIVSGVAAGALSLRHHINKTAALYVCYVDCTEFMDCKELITLLDELKVNGILKDATFNYIPKSNMYM